MQLTINHISVLQYFLNGMICEKPLFFTVKPPAVKLMHIVMATEVFNNFSYPL